MIGGSLQMGRPVGRELAQDFRGWKSRLAQRQNCVRLMDVVAIRSLRIGTGCLNRYPSPVGRTGFPRSCPPIFLPIAPRRQSCGPDRRSFAHFASLSGFSVVSKGAMASFGGETGHKKKGLQECRLENGSRARYAPSPSRAVATPCLSRGLSARAQARPQPWCWMAVLLPAPSPVRRSTSPIASNTRRAADAVAAADRLRGLTPAATVTELKNHRSAPRAGGFLLSHEPPLPGGCPIGQEPEGT